jgi:hypothetical protein
MARVFISYAAPDRVLALRLAQDMTQFGHQVWLDLWQLGVGDSLVRGIGDGLTQAEYLIVLLSPHATQSAWMEREWEVLASIEITQRRTMILPVLLADCVVPILLRNKRFADFRSGYALGLAQLAITFHSHHVVPSDTIASSISDASVHSEPMIVPHDRNGVVCYSGDMVSIPSKMSEVSVELGLPYVGKITGLWKPDADEQFAAWELYVELVTRVPVAELHDEEGSLREALTSLYTIFTLTRELLHKYGPAIARPKQGGEISFGVLAITILNTVLRPLLAKWHPLLLEYEHRRVASIGPSEHERQWEQAEELRGVLNEIRQILVNYANLLAQVAGVSPLN